MPPTTDVERASMPGASMRRRTVLKGAAWSLPVVAAAVAVPMATASTGGEAKLTGSFEASFLTLNTEQFVRGYLKLNNYWNNDAQTQTTVSQITAYFDVADDALASPLQSVDLITNDPASQVSTWVYQGSSAAGAGKTRLTFVWTGALNPSTSNISTVVEWRTRAGSAVYTGSGFDTTITGAATSPQAAAPVAYTDTTGTPG